MGNGIRRTGEVGMSKERIIESLEYCRKNQKSNDCESCEYGGRSFQICERLVDDILVLLKEQEAVPVIQREVIHMLVWCCGSCGVAITAGDKFCRMCGKQVKWK